MIDLEANALRIFSKMIEAVEVSMTEEMRGGVLGGYRVIAFAVAKVEKENSKKAAKKMTEAEADTLKILTKATEAAEALI